MSHVADVQLHIKDLSCLKQAVEKMGGEFVEGQKTFKWYGRFLNDWRDAQGRIVERAAINRVDRENFGKCLHAIKIPGCGYEIGVIAHESGKGYKVIYDEFGEGVKLREWLGGENYAMIKSHYGARVFSREMKSKGYRVTTATAANGRPIVNAIK